MVREPMLITGIQQERMLAIQIPVGSNSQPFSPSVVVEYVLFRSIIHDLWRSKIMVAGFAFGGEKQAGANLILIAQIESVLIASAFVFWNDSHAV